ncbi:MAG: helix-turn-helix domain-containing protein [Syntrophobacteraceae bacterium]
MTPFEIKVALMKRGVSMRSIAKKLGVSANSVSLVVNRRMVSRRIMEEIAGAITTDMAEVFPGSFRTSSPRSKIL